MSKLIDAIKHKNNNIYPIDNSFYTFISDHKNQIKENSEIVMLEPETKVKFNNRIKELLRKGNRDNALYWIYCIINEVTLLSQLFNKDNVYIPREDYINELIIKYRNIQAKKNSGSVKLSTLKG